MAAISPAAASPSRFTAQPTALMIAQPTVAATRKPGTFFRLIDDRVAESDRNGMGARVGLELGEDVPNVALHRLLADEEAGGDIGVRHAVGEQLQDLALALRQHFLALAREEGGHEGRIDVALAACDLLDGAQESLVRGLFQDVALRTGLEPAAEEAALAVRGEDEHRGARQALGENLGRL